MALVLQPGDNVPAEALPQQKGSKHLTIGPGLQYTPPSTIKATAAGSLLADGRKNAIWLENNGGGRYIPAIGDVVIAVVQRGALDAYYCSITPYTVHASLPYLAFEGASKKTRPQLQQGSLVYARVALAEKHMDPELECFHGSTGKADGLGELKNGTVFDISLGMARRLLMNRVKEEGCVGLLEELGEKGVRFEVAIGRNGQVWIDSENIKSTSMIGRALQDIDEKGLTLEEQSKLARKLIKEVT